MKKGWILFLILLLLVGCDRKSEKEKTPISNSKKVTVEKDLFENYYQEAEKKIVNMTLEEKVGQLFLARMNQDVVESEIQTFHPGGYVLFARDFENETKESITTKIKKYQQLTTTPMIMAVDEEGGTVTRVSRFPNFRSMRFQSNQELYAQGGFDMIIATEKEKVSLLRELGLNLNLAPVADISINPNDYMYSRSFGQDAISTSNFIKYVVQTNYENQFASCLKHFPGYGSNVDTHTGIAIDERSYESFLENDFLPFQAGIKERVPTILVSHNIVKSMDEASPASLSYKVHQILREQLKFSGLIITDDLAMDAISNYTNDENSAVLAIKAGNDLVITSSLQTDYEAVLKALQDGKISSSIIENALKRIIAFKYAYHIA